MREVAADIALLAAGIGFMAGMLVVVLPMTLARCAYDCRAVFGDVALGLLLGIPLWWQVFPFFEAMAT